MLKTEVCFYASHHSVQCVETVYVCKTVASRLPPCYAWLCIGHSWYPVILPFPLKTHKQTSDAHFAVGCKMIWDFWAAKRLNMHWKILHQSRWLGSWKCIFLHVFILWGRIFYAKISVLLDSQQTLRCLLQKWNKFDMKINPYHPGCHLYTFSWTPVVISHTKVKFHVVQPDMLPVLEHATSHKKKKKIISLNLILWNTCLTHLNKGIKLPNKKII